ncbi:MAG: LIC12162 family protein [bacterium]
MTNYLNKTKSKTFIALSSNAKFWDLSADKIVFICPSCVTDDNKACLNNINVIYHQKPNQSYQEHQDLNQKLFNDAIIVKNLLIPLLNNIHARQYTEKYWNIILLPFIFYFIQDLSGVYQKIKSIKLTYKQWNTILLDPIDYQTSKTVGDYLNSSSHLNNRQQLYSKVIQYLGHSFKTQRDEKIELHKTNNNISRSIKKMMWDMIETLSNKVCMWVKNPMVYVDTYIRRQCLLMLLFKTKGQSVWITSNQDVLVDKPISNEMRKQVSELANHQKDPFIKCALTVLSSELPKSFLELFDKYEEKAENSFPKSPKKIITSIGLYRNESIRFWLAKCRENNIPLLNLQHGGNYGVFSNLYHSQRIEEICSNKFLSYGWDRAVENKNNSKIVPFYIMKQAFLNKKKKVDKQRPILMVGYNAYKGNPFVFNPNIDQYLCWQIQFLKKLSLSVQQQLLYRGFIKLTIDITQRIKEEFPDLQVEKMTVTPIEKRILSSKLVVIDRPVTVFLEALSLNKPILLFWNPMCTDIDFHVQAKSYFNALKDVGILHHCPIKASETLNHIIGHEEEWFHEPKRYKAAMAFREKFARTAKDPVKALQELINL